MKSHCIFRRRGSQMNLCCEPPFERPIFCSPLDFLAPAASGWTLMLVLSMHIISVRISIIFSSCKASKIRSISRFCTSDWIWHKSCANFRIRSAMPSIFSRFRLYTVMHTENHNSILPAFCEVLALNAQFSQIVFRLISYVYCNTLSGKMQQFNVSRF